MREAFALTRTAYTAAQASRIELARGMIVLASAAALILAGQPLPL